MGNSEDAISKLGHEGEKELSPVGRGVLFQVDKGGNGKGTESPEAL